VGGPRSGSANTGSRRGLLRSRPVANRAAPCGRSQWNASPKSSLAVSNNFNSGRSDAVNRTACAPLSVVAAGATCPFENSSPLPPAERRGSIRGAEGAQALAALRCCCTNASGPIRWEYVVTSLLRRWCPPSVNRGRDAVMLEAHKTGVGLVSCVISKPADSTPKTLKGKGAHSTDSSPRN